MLGAREKDAVRAAERNTAAILINLEQLKESLETLKADMRSVKNSVVRKHEKKE